MHVIILSLSITIRILCVFQIYLKRPNPYKCSHCKASYSDRRNLVGHLLLKHRIGKPRICKQCGASFVWQSKYSAHQKECSVIRQIGTIQEDQIETIGEDHREEQIGVIGQIESIGEDQFEETKETSDDTGDSI